MSAASMLTLSSSGTFRLTQIIFVFGSSDEVHGAWAADTGAAVLRTVVHWSSLCVAGTAEALWCGNSWDTWPPQRDDGTRPVGCLKVCFVPYEYLCRCAFARRNALGPSPLFLSVCYLQPSCHISPLPATFLVNSEGATYLFSEWQASCLYRCRNRGRTVKTESDGLGNN